MAVEYTPEMVLKKLKEILAMFGRRAADKNAMIDDLKLLATKASDPAALLKVCAPRACCGVARVHVRACAGQDHARGRTVRPRVVRRRRLHGPGPCARRARWHAAGEDERTTGRTTSLSLRGVARRTSGSSASRVWRISSLSCARTMRCAHECRA